jgi:hypothetical protein
VHAGEAAATESATAKASAPPGVCIGEKDRETNKNGEKEYQAKLENAFHDARLPNL